MVVVPAATPVTSPVELIVATPVLTELHVPPLTISVSCVELPAHTLIVPLTGPKPLGAGAGVFDIAIALHSNKGHRNM